MSGGAILSIDNNHINIMGIQSKMASSSGYQAGQVAFVPISLFNDIIEYDEYKSILTPLIPNYLKSFQFVKDNIFKLEQGLLTKDISTKLMKILNTKATSLISSDITPYKIKRHLVEELKLISDYQYKRYNNPKFWSKWLELLTVINIVELQPFGGSTPLTADKIQIILENIRLFYSDSDECFWLKNIDNLHKMNYNGLAENSTIIVASNVKAADMHILDNTLIVGNIARVRDEFDLDKISGKIDSATDGSGAKMFFV